MAKLTIKELVAANEKLTLENAALQDTLATARTLYAALRTELRTALAVPVKAVKAVKPAFVRAAYIPTPWQQAKAQRNALAKAQAIATGHVVLA